MKVNGHAVSKGIGIGKVLIYEQFTPKITEEKIDNIEKEVQTFFELRSKAEQEINAIIEMLKSRDDDKYKIFEAHLEILNDIALEEMITDLIKSSEFNVGLAIYNSFEEFIEMLSMVEDELIQERVLDLKDVRTRLLRILSGEKEKNLSSLKEKTIVVAYDLYPSDTATIDRAQVEAIVTEVGGKTSHTAIIAKNYGIPAILGVQEFVKNFKDQDLVVVDAIDNKIIINPDEKVVKEYEEIKANFLEKQRVIDEYLSLEAITLDNEKVDIHLNIGSTSADELEYEKYSDGVGLFRSEFLYMENTKLPTEEEQFLAYKKVLEHFKDKPVILRTLDIGGDKTLSYFDLPKEDNPFLGLRALRLCLEHEDIFITQLRAAYRASIYGDLWLMFPMVGSIDDIYAIHNILDKVKKSLDNDQISYKKDVKIGVMIEIPSIVMVADKVAELVDFASIGTNDLTQYITAVDRMNPQVASYYQNYGPSMIRFLKIAIDAFTKANKPLSVCGEMGGDMIGTPILLGLGYRKLSMSKSMVAEIKYLIRNNEIKKFEEVINEAMTLNTEKEVVQLIKANFGG